MSRKKGGKSVTADRNERGQFQPGHSIKSPGRPPRAQYMEALANAVTSAKWKQIVEKAVKDAIAGDRFARQFLAEYLIGKPEQTINLTGPDQALLAILLVELERIGLTASTVFQGMLDELALESGEDDDPG